MASGKLMDWQFLRETYIDTGTPVEDPILDDPEFRLIFHPNPRQLGVRLFVGNGRDLPKVGELKNVKVNKVQIGGQSYAQVLTDAVQLFPSIYALIGDVLRRIEAGETDCVAALASSLRNFEALVARAGEISREDAIGLYGELLVLESLIQAGKADAKAWIGANRQSHDIRIKNVELEIKTTSSNNRHHFVHGLNQLTPSPDHDLHVVSVRLASPGSGTGRSLDQLVSDLLAVLSGDKESATYFENELDKTPYQRGDYECTVPYRLGADLMLVSIGKDFPTINHSTLEKMFGESAAGRVMRLELLLNFEGLGSHFNPESL